MEWRRRGSLDAIDAQTYAYAGMTKAEFASIAGPVFARTQGRIEEACGGPRLADVIYGWCESDPERMREYNAAAREAHHTGDSSRMQAIARAFHLA